MNILLDRVGESAFQRLQAIERQLPDAPDVVALCAERLDIRLRAYFYDSVDAERYAANRCVGEADAVRSDHARQQLVIDAEMASLGDWDWRPQLAEITAPVLYVHPVFDLVDTTRALEYVQAVPDGRLVVIDRSGHMPYFEEPDPFLSALRRFLSGEWPENAIAPNTD